jgi:hypothetical protein
MVFKWGKRDDTTFKRNLHNISESMTVTTNTISVKGRRITYISDPLDPQDAVTLGYLKSNYELQSIGGTSSRPPPPPTQPLTEINAHNLRVINLGDPLHELDAINKRYLLNEINKLGNFDSILQKKTITLDRSGNNFTAYNNRVTNIGSPKSSRDAVNLSYMIEYVEKKFAELKI